MDHLADYLEETKKTLIKSTDQTIEATHSKFDRYLKDHGYFRKNASVKSYNDKLHLGFLAWNSYALGYNE